MVYNGAIKQRSGDKTMEYVIYYHRPHKSWYGYWTTSELEQLGEAVFAASKEDCLILLGEVKEDRRILMENQK